MADALGLLAVFFHGFRIVLFAVGVALAVVAAADWGVRTRRINPFSGFARFMRSYVDPHLTGIERQVVRAGGQPSSAPWWALIAYVAGAALLVAAVKGFASLLVEAHVAAARGELGLFLLLVRWTFAFLKVALIIRVVLSWLPRLSGSRWLSWSFGATEWMLRPLRRLVPTLGVIDITPIVAYFGLIIVEWIVESILLAGLI
jgi:YggT family protein